MLSPGWKYNLNVIKHINGTEDFLAQSDSEKNCQLESQDNCTTRSYVDRVTDKCGCLPLSMIITGQQKEINGALIFTLSNLISSGPHVQVRQNEMCKRNNYS